MPCLAFRTNGLLSRFTSCRQHNCRCDCVFVHFVDVASALGDAEMQRLRALLVYGDAFDGGEDGERFVVIPLRYDFTRGLKLTSPCNCGMQQINVGRRELCNILCKLKPAYLAVAKTLSAASKQAVADLLHDRMTEMGVGRCRQGSGLFRELEAAAFGILVDVGGW